jgi:hypothetical protein
MTTATVGYQAASFADDRAGAWAASNAMTVQSVRMVAQAPNVLAAHLVATGQGMQMITEAQLQICPRAGSTSTVTDCSAAVDSLTSAAHTRLGKTTMEICESLRAWEHLHDVQLPRGVLARGVDNRPCAYLTLTPLLCKGLLCRTSLVIEGDAVADLICNDTLEVFFVPTHMQCMLNAPSSIAVPFARVERVVQLEATAQDDGRFVQDLRLRRAVSALWFDPPGGFANLPSSVRMTLTLEDGTVLVLLAPTIESMGPSRIGSGFVLHFDCVRPVGTSGTEFVFVARGDTRHDAEVAVNFDKVRAVNVVMEFRKGRPVPDAVPVFQVGPSTLTTSFPTVETASAWYYTM